MKPDPPVRCIFKKWKPYTPVLFVELECVQNVLWWQPLQWSQTAERGRRGAFSKGKKEITAKLNMLGTVDVSLNEIIMWNRTWCGFSWRRPTKTVSLVKIVIFLPLHSQPCSLFKYWIAIFLLERHFCDLISFEF